MWSTRYYDAAGVITNGKDGFIVSHPPDYEEIASKMALLLDNEFRERMSALAMEQSHNYTLGKNHNQIIQILNEVADEQQY